MSSAVASDGDLVALVASGKLEALGELFERYESDLRTYVVRLGVSRSDGDDLVQATFLEVMRASHRFDPNYSVRAWLFGIATIMVRRHRRSLANAAARVALWAGVVRHDPAPTPAELLEGDRATRKLHAALARLSQKKREVFVLVTIEGLRGEEVAGLLGIPVNTVWTRLHHARSELRAALAEEAP
jgi:RNA polymerase sigma-70 factor (ECF subfamily)